ncbi:MAG: ribonuclease HI [Actinobacteria bacterium]|nr:ribonuclease HI [Actinomycetota bacterium]
MTRAHGQDDRTRHAADELRNDTPRNGTARKGAPRVDVVKIFSDGACSGNPGPGGYGAILLSRGHRKELSGGEPDTTNNRMELRACIEALRALKYPCDVEITSDSRYVVQGIEDGWAERWRRNGWMRDKKTPAKNADLWQELLELCATHRVRFLWVRGHDGHPENERADALAVAAIQGVGRR